MGEECGEELEFSWKSLPGRKKRNICKPRDTKSPGMSSLS
jgi:hypothetical protein